MKSIYRVAMTSFAFGLLCLLAAVDTASADAAGDEAAIIQMIHDTCKAYLHADVAKMTELLTEDFTLTDASGVITTRADDIEIAKKGTLKYDIFENYDMKVRLYGDSAVVTGKTRVKGKVGENPFAAEFQFTDTIVRRDGRWLFAASHISRLES
jgi:ketosteroid isomerase-like protein